VLWQAFGQPSNAYATLAAIEPATPVLLTTADHPLLLPEYIDYFCHAAIASGADVAVGLASHARVREIFPTMKKTVLNFRDDDYCGCNLFAFLSPAGRAMADRWREVESERKTPLRVVRLLGWSAVLRYRAAVARRGWSGCPTHGRPRHQMPFGDGGCRLAMITHWSSSLLERRQHLRRC
jgi:hypothetical protein